MVIRLGPLTSKMAWDPPEMPALSRYPIGTGAECNAVRLACGICISEDPSHRGSAAGPSRGPGTWEGLLFAVNVTVGLWGAGTRCMGCACIFYDILLYAFRD